MINIITPIIVLLLLYVMGLSIIVFIVFIFKSYPNVQQHYRVVNKMLVVAWKVSVRTNKLSVKKGS